ncbi:MAG: signal peptidase I [Devosia sp.]
MSQTTMTKADKKPKNEVIETFVVIVEALIIAVLFRTFLWQPFSIPTASMQSTLMIGDYFVANKWAWGLGKYSFPFPVPLGNRILAIGEPQRGDIAVFHNITNEDYIKRIIGLPGDKLQMKEGRLYINGTIVPREEVGTGVDVNDGLEGVPVTIYHETLPNGVVHPIQEISDDEFLDNTDEYVVPAGHYFMMGDNRDRSADSRVLAQVGYVPATNIIGKAEARFFSIQDNTPPWQIWQWPAKARWDRMFESVYQTYTTTPTRSEVSK